MLTKWFEKWFCEIVGHLWCLLDEFWRLLVSSTKLLLVFGWILRISSLGPPVGLVPLVIVHVDEMA